MKVYIPDTQSFNVYVSIDQELMIGNPIIQGSAPAVDTVVPVEFVSDIKGNDLEPYKLTSMTSATATPYSIIYFTVTPNFPT